MDVTHEKCFSSEESGNAVPTLLEPVEAALGAFSDTCSGCCTLKESAEGAQGVSLKELELAGALPAVLAACETLSVG